MPENLSLVGSRAVETFIFGRLTGLLSQTPDDIALVRMLRQTPAEGRLHKWPVPDDYPLPHGTFYREGGDGDLGPIGGPAVASNHRYQVKYVCEGFSTDPIDDAAAIANDLLDGASATIGIETHRGLTTFYVECIRLSELLLDLPPEEDGGVFQHVGGIYGFFVSRVA